MLLLIYELHLTNNLIVKHLVLLFVLCTFTKVPCDDPKD